MKPKLVITNRSRYPDEEVTALVRFAFNTIHEHRPIQKSELHVRFTNTRNAWDGGAYQHGAYRDRFGAHVTIRIGRPEQFAEPKRISYDSKWKDMPVYFLNDYREAMVYIAAHEFAHTMGSSGRKDGEMFCDFAGQDAVDAYRRQRAEFDAEIARRLQARRDREAATAANRKARKAERNSPAHRLETARAKLDELQRQQRRLARRIHKAKLSVRGLERSVRRQEAETIALAAAPKDSRCSGERTCELAGQSTATHAGCLLPGKTKQPSTAPTTHNPTP